MANLLIIVSATSSLRFLSKNVLPLVSRTLPYGFIGFVCYGLDAICLSMQNVHLRAILDNFTHGIISCISWYIVSEIRTPRDVIDAISSGIIACSLDVDHFVAAKSLKLQDALHLQNRPFLHSTTVVFIVVPMLEVFLAQNIPYLQSLPYLFAVAIISHHLRDGHRRGLWFWPIGSTPAIPYWLYVVYIVALPYFVKELKVSMEKTPDFPVSNNLLFNV